MKKLKKLMLIGLLLMSVSGCSLLHKDISNEQNNLSEEGSDLKQETTTQNSASQMVIAMNTPKTLNPLYNTQANVEQALYLIFSPLVNIKEDGSISANLAKSWVTNEDNTAVTITLKEGLTWHDGMPLTSDDVIFTLGKIQTIADSPYKQAVENLQTVEKIDSTTFKIVYKQSFSSVLQTLFFPVIPEHIYNVENSDSMSITPIGSGPYKYESTTPLEAIHLVANANYFNGKPNIEKIQINLIPDEASSLHSFKQGLIDVIYTSETEWGKYANNNSNPSVEMVSPIYEFMGLNFNKPLFQNEMVRNALVYALNREDIVRLYYLGHAVITDTPISPTSYLYDKNLEIKAYDKEKARLLLTQEGYQLDNDTGLMTKNGIPFSFTLMVNKENSDRVKVAKEMQRMYAEIGIDMQIDIVDKDVYLSRLVAKQYDAFLGGWQLSYALDLSFAFHSASVLNGENYISYRDNKMDELLQQAFLATSDTIYEAYSELQQYFASSNPYISLYFKKSVLMTQNTIGGNIEPTPLNVFANVEEWTIGKK
ncbi:MAG: peptide ABC transporter substrate-binding protein [Candidatus Cellulosilyticum pullistercoris]|uniref:Peptide ABC transporter substrate-binding protein n=1 Tax=Candidatus Cellulosilyticum pullistercoris TaxID=2838521 RepID=A0A9E2NK43_9FIRM|nr:peptide ABC transporter substrate-binding protein [Candidatus Cellulosilyticum pullistercoris]